MQEDPPVAEEKITNKTQTKRAVAKSQQARKKQERSKNTEPPKTPFTAKGTKLQLNREKMAKNSTYATEQSPVIFYDLLPFHPHLMLQRE